MAELRFPRIRRIDDLWAKGERLLAAGLFLLMGLLVFAQVVTKVFGRRHEVIDVVILFGVVLLGVRTRSLKEGEKRTGWGISLAITAGATVALAGLVWLYTWQVPTGLLWAQKVAMVLLIWVAMLGASIATHDRSHLALEMGEKIWPKTVLHWVRALAHTLTSAVSFAFLVVSVEIVSGQRARGAHIAEAVTAADPIPIIGTLPTWIAFLIVPYAFASMTVRYMAQAVTTATRTEAPMEERLPS